MGTAAEAQARVHMPIVAVGNLGLLGSLAVAEWKPGVAENGSLSVTENAYGSLSVAEAMSGSLRVVAEAVGSHGVADAVAQIPASLSGCQSPHATPT